MVLAELLMVFTNRQLGVSGAMQWISSLTMLSLTFGLVGLAIGLGALYPRYSAENLGQMATGFGGFLYMLCSLALIGLTIVLEAGPVYRMLITDLRSTPLSLLDRWWMIGSFGAVFFMHISSGIWAMRKGRASLEKT
jgi:ABC-2 type transport system permease protein